MIALKRHWTDYERAIFDEALRGIEAARRCARAPLPIVMG